MGERGREGDRQTDREIGENKQIKTAHKCGTNCCHFIHFVATEKLKYM